MSEKYLEAIKQPIQDEESAAKETEEHVFLEEEMTKFSSMRENTLDWKRAEKSALTILSEQSKNLRVLAHLILCLQHDRDAERFILSIEIINEFIENFWKSAKPKIQPVKKELLTKKKILRQILLRSEKATRNLDLTEGDRALLPKFTKTLEKLEKVVSKVGLEYEDYWKLSSEFTKALPPEPVIQKQSVEKTTAKQGQQTNQEKTKTTDQSTQKSSSSQVVVDTSEVTLDAGNERETKQTFFKLATFLNTAFEKEPLGYRIRRFALWFNINAMPPLRKDGNTEMMAISSDQVSEFNEAVVSDCNLELLKTIEQTVAFSPFWISGSYLSSRVAEALEMGDVSEAIQEETARFIKRMPSFLEAKFSDGTPFVDAPTRRWLTTDDSAFLGAGDAWNTKLKDAVQLAKQGKFKNGLTLLEKGISSAKQPRDRFYWRLASATFMEQTGMKSLANEEYNSLNLAIEDINVPTWEPLLVDEIQGKVKSKTIKSMVLKTKKAAK